MNTTSTLVTITPSIAQEMLTHNTHNRPLSNATIYKYASFIKRGEWVVNGESIKFDCNGNLIDGQHRLKAVIISGKPIQSYVVRGLDPEVFSVIDTNLKRTARHALALDGAKYYQDIAAVIPRVMLLVRNNALRGNNAIDGISNTQILSIYREHRDEWEASAAFASALYYSEGRLPISRIDVGAYHYFLIHYKHHHPELVEKFLKSILSYSSCDDQMLETLRKRLLRDLTGNTKMKREYKQSLITKVWNAWVNQQSLRCIKWDKEKEGEYFFV